LEKIMESAPRKDTKPPDIRAAEQGGNLMGRLLFTLGALALLLTPASLIGRTDLIRADVTSSAGALQAAPPFTRFCPSSPPPHVVEIRDANPQVNKTHHDQMRKLLVDSVPIPNTTILLGPDVVLDFSDASADDLPLSFGPCVTLTSVSAFRPDTTTDPRTSALAATSGNVTAVTATPSPGTSTSSRPMPVETNASITVVDKFQLPARTPHSLGPLLTFGPHRGNDKNVFLAIDCPANTPPNDNVRISGFRLYGPSVGQQSVEDTGINIFRCLNIEISNMEIAGWGGQGIKVEDNPEPGGGQESPNNAPGERIGRPDQIRISGNYIHHNQHPREGLIDDHAAGYGVNVHHGAWATVYENVFDANRHAIAAAGDTGGYEALRNLVLKGGGYHYAGFYTHQFDIHGSGDNGFGGQAGIQFWYATNSFQYRSAAAISIRGRPQVGVYIHDNVFPHEGLESDWGDDAIEVDNGNDLDVIHLGPNNAINFDSYGRYGVCDFDGDGIDDLFLATGQTWWFSSFGEFQWTYLGAHTERLTQVRLGYFDADNRCDVLTESDRQWVISSGGTGPWQSLGVFGAPLAEVAFGQFDPAVRDHRPGVTRRTTHAFRRTPAGEWLVTPLSAPAWQQAQSSSFPMNQLRFGDFTGDGVTDVLAVENGKWSISDGATGSWQRLNSSLSDDVSTLYIADLDNNNIDDLIKLEVTARLVNPYIEETLTWWVSDDGRSPWRKLKTYTLQRLAYGSALPLFAYAGRFGAAPGGGVLLTDHDRMGRFYSPGEIPVGASPGWSSLFAY
jgi:hypothetical protein